MCCFSRNVHAVEATRIFARMSAPGRQVLAYQMKVAADAAVAMILPLPVATGAGEDAVRFISLEAYPKLFEDLDQAFPQPPVSRGHGPPVAFGRLAVVKVGKFVASFVPSLADFARLDPQFRVPDGTLDRVRAYRTYGFAVFQLDVGAGALTEIHPMAFEFPTREPGKLYFPTVHVHDGSLPKKAKFAHQLYAQGVAKPNKRGWEMGDTAAGHVDRNRAQGLVDFDAEVHRLKLLGELPNEDQWVAALR